MVLAVSSVADIDVTTNAQDYAFAAFTPTANSLLVIHEGFTGCDGTAGAPTIVTDDQGLTWTLQLNTGTAVTAQAIYTAPVGGSPASTTITVHSVASDAATGCQATILEYTGQDAAPVVQANSDTFVSSGTPTWTPSTLDTNNAYSLSVHILNNPTTVTQPASWTQDRDLGAPAPAHGMMVAYRVNGETGTSVSCGSTAPKAGFLLGIEIAVAAAGGATPKGPLGHPLHGPLFGPIGP